MQQAIAPSTQSQPTTLPALSEHKIARFAAVIVLYFLQGLPLGLSLIALPAWLSEAGATPVEVGAFVGIAFLPWSTKLFNGLVMDRYAFKPMGRRRGWILLAHVFMLAALIFMAITSPGAGDIALLSALCFTLNMCGTFNDVAVDGMVVDIVPESERTVINSMMFASQVAGMALSGFLAGQTLASGGVAKTALVLAAMIVCASLFVGIFRERPGERLLPWTQGQASPECEERQHDAWWPILSGVFVSVFSPRILMFLIAAGLSWAYAAFSDAVNPTLAVEQLGWSSEDYASFGAVINIVAAGFGLFVPITLERMLGLRWAILGQMATVALLATIAGLSFPFWQSDLPFIVLSAAMYILCVTIAISAIVWAMRICNPLIAASQFALFMAAPNLSRSLLSGNSGWVVEGWGYGATYLVVAGLTVLAIVFGWFARIGDDSQLPHAAPAQS
ncbi:MAG: MFS transporter [Pseudomonadota bacterium]